MRPARGQRQPSRASPYRTPPEPVPDAADGRAPRVEPSVTLILLAVLACSLVRLGLFIFHGARQGPDGVLALAASATTAYYLCRLLRG